MTGTDNKLGDSVMLKMYANNNALVLTDILTKGVKRFAKSGFL